MPVPAAIPSGACQARVGLGGALRARTVSLCDQVRDLPHDPVDVEVLGRVDAGHARPAHRLGVGRRDDAADHDRSLTALAAEQLHDARHQLPVRAREDREPDHVDVLLHGRAGDLLGGEADALVDDLHAGVARPHRDLLGAVGVPVEAGFAHQDPDRDARGPRRPPPRAVGSLPATPRPSTRRRPRRRWAHR